MDIEDLQRLATSAFLSGRDDDFQQCVEQLHRAHLDAGQKPEAARCTFWLSLSLLVQGKVAQSNGWVSRGHRHIDGLDCVEHGYLHLPAAEVQLREGKADDACTIAGESAAIGERFGDVDLIAAARHVQGRALIQQEKVSAGLRLLDEMMLAVVSGELSPLMTGLMYCSVIDTCQQVFALNRAREWTAAMSRWLDERPDIIAFTGVCMVHRAEIMQFDGAWPDAIAEACRACERCQRADRNPPAAAFYQQGEIHRLRGEIAEAEDAYRRASELGYEPQPGLALLRLIQGRTDAACATIRRLMSVTTNRLRRARLLPAYVEILVRTGDLEEARAACGELREIAEAFDADILRAHSAHAQGAIVFEDGDAGAALGSLHGAFDLWRRLESPYECARVRVLIGLACRTLEDDETSALELDAARAAFEELRARPDLARLEILASRTVPRNGHPLTTRELDVLRLIAAGGTNKAIAARLSLSERTIDRHVSNILNKLDVPSRAAATAYAYDHKIL